MLTKTIRDFVIKAFQEVDYQLQFSGEGVPEKGVVKATNNSLLNLNIGGFDLDTLYFNIEVLESVVSDKTKLIFTVNLLGNHYLDMSEHIELLKATFNKFIGEKK